MKLRVLFHSLVCVLGLGMAGIATAAYIITDDIVDPISNPVIYPFGSATGTFYLYEHDITDNGWLSGGSLVSASLTVLLRDFTDSDAGNEYFQFVIGLDPNQQLITGLFNVNSSGDGTSFGPYLLNVSSLADLNSNGRISLKIESRLGPNGTSFIFDKSTLNVTAGSGPVSAGPGASGTVPEPSMLLLLCLGFAMLVWYARRGPVAS